MQNVENECWRVDLSAIEKRAFLLSLHKQRKATRRSTRRAVSWCGVVPFSMEKGTPPPAHRRRVLRLVALRCLEAKEKGTAFRSPKVPLPALIFTFCIKVKLNISIKNARVGAVSRKRRYFGRCSSSFFWLFLSPSLALTP